MILPFNSNIYSESSSRRDRDRDRDRRDRAYGGETNAAGYATGRGRGGTTVLGDVYT